MGAIVLDANKVNSYVLNNLAKSKNYINDAYSTSQSLKKYLPSSFSSRSLITEISNQLYNINKEISNIEQIISHKIDSAKKIESKTESKVSSIAGQLGAVTGAIGGAVIGTKTSGIVGAVVGAKVGSEIGKKIGKTGAKTSTKVVSGVKKIVNGAWNFVKTGAKKITDGGKTVAKWVSEKAKVANDWIGNTASKVGNWVSNKFNAAKDWTCKALKDTGAWISNAATSVWKWVTNGENWKKLGASIVNGALSFVKGLVSLVESILDFALIILSAVGTIGTGLYDIVNGIATGNWDWSATKSLWKDTVVPAVTYDWTSALDKKIGWRQYFDQWAYEPFKSDGTGCQILEGVGYIAGIIVLTIVTFGAGSAVATVGGTTAAGVSSGLAVGTAAAEVTGATLTITTSSLAAGGIATAAGIGKNTAAAWNDGADVLSGLGYGVAKGTYEGFEMTAGYTINGLKLFKGAGVLSQVGNSMSHVALDTIDGGSGGLIDPLFTMIYSPNQKNLEDIMKYVNYDENGNKINDKKWDDLSFGEKYNAIFQYKGGWNTVATQAASAAAMSFLSEIPEIRGSIRASKALKIATDGELILPETNIASKQLLNKLEEQKLENILELSGKDSRGKILGAELYKKLEYDSKPVLVDSAEFNNIVSNSKYGKIYRGITGENADLYINQFKNGDLYVGGGRGAIKGTGIYAGYGENAFEEIAKKYATNVGNSSGEIIEMALSKNAKIIDFDTIVKEQDEVLTSMSKKFNKYSKDIVDVDSLKSNLSKITDLDDLKEAKYIINILQDPGYYASLRGYDAIDVVDKQYLLICNRGKVVIEDSNLNNIDVLKKSKMDIKISETKDINLYKNHGSAKQIRSELGLSLDSMMEIKNILNSNQKSVLDILDDPLVSKEVKLEIKQFLYTTSTGRDLLKFTSDEIESINNFCGEAYRHINESLISTEKSIVSDAYINKVIKNIHSLIEKSTPLEQDTLLFRGTSLSYLKHSLEDPNIINMLEKGDLSNLKGNIITSKGFMSTSFDKSVSEHFFEDAVMTIKAPKGSKVLDLTVASLQPFESEVLLNNNSKFLIEGVEEIIIDGKKGYNFIVSLLPETENLKPELSIFGHKNKIQTAVNPQKLDINLNLTNTQKETINQINNFIASGRKCSITYDSTSSISSAMLSQIDDLSMVEIKLLDGLGDGAGSLKSKYLGKSKYDTRISYSGYEMKAIIERIEDLQSKVDMNLPITARAKQIYNILSTEVPVMYDHGQYLDGHLVSASLRGLTNYNSVGKEGLVCAGYASVYKELCERSGIKCDYVRGTAYSDPLRKGESGGHAWNVVYTDEGLIPVDVTWKASSGGRRDWFGASENFSAQHVSDLDEFHQDFSSMIPSILTENPTEKLESVLNILEKKYGTREVAIDILNQYTETLIPEKITRTDGARSAILSLDVDTIKKFVGKIEIDKKISDAISTIDIKNGTYGYGIDVLNSYLETNDSLKLTRTNGVREFISSLDKAEIQRYLLERGQLK